ncbi:hypothetical protein QBC38DRAFT_451443 [Podospora fimiseda]|uniref:Uncharacterized protein n=1 Tax=Podospora fimiseda TaxID=252190 RepID=A0AAN7BXF8_9PEZI|nr:hypothetical protein QBC38DRAFT_451443 [Podospora fimiseda]
MDGPPVETSPPGLRPSLSLREHHHHGGSPPPSARAIDPPRPPREGRPSTPNKSPDSRIWIRRRRSRKSQSGSGGYGGHESEISATTPPKALHVALGATVPMTPQSPYLSESAHVYSLQNPREEVTTSQEELDGEWLSPKHSSSYASAPTPRTDSPDKNDFTPPRIHRQFSWNRLSHSFKKNSRDQLKKSEKSESSEQSQSEDVKMETVKKFLDRLPEAEKPEPDIKSPTETTKSRRVRFGRVLWRKASGRPSPPTVASQDREARPTPPPPQILISQFPGGEAKRVHTPPYKEDTADGRPRSLFFDLNSPSSNSNVSINAYNSGGESDSTTSTRRSHSTASSKIVRFNRDSSRSPVNPSQRNKSPVLPGTKRKDTRKKPSNVSRPSGHSNASQGSVSREWWEQHQQHQPQRSGNTTPVNGQKSGGNGRTNPKNVRSGGKGVCVYHGRRKSSRHLLPGSDSISGLPDEGSQIGTVGGMKSSEEGGNKSP